MDGDPQLPADKQNLRICLKKNSAEEYFLLNIRAIKFLYNFAKSEIIMGITVSLI